MNINGKWAGLGIAVAAILTIIMMNVSWNEAGNRQVVQYADGTLACEFEPGPYLTYFGSSTGYPDVMTFDFDKTEAGGTVTLDQNGISVRYRDGGLGTVYGISRYNLPDDCPTMIKVHKEYKNRKNLAYKGIKPFTEEVANQTAGLMTSEESYAEKRGTFTDWFRTQLVGGRFKTRMVDVVTTEPGREYCLDTELLNEQQANECSDVKKTRERVPVIDDSTPDIHLPSDLNQYGITLAAFQLQNPDYEPKTLQQIADKREATMGVITAKANAERAKAEAEEQKQKGIKAVVKAKYDEEQIAAKEVVQAEKKVKLAEQHKMESEEKALAAVHYKREQILKGQGEAERKRLVMEADGALQQKIDAWKDVTKVAFHEFGKQKWVSEVTMGGTSGDQANNAAALIDLLMVNNARQLGLDMSMEARKR